MVKWMTILFGSVPILGWLASMPCNWSHFGTPFTACGEWNNYPLFLATLPCLQIGDAIFSGHPFPLVLEHPYLGVILYTCLYASLFISRFRYRPSRARMCLCVDSRQEIRLTSRQEKGLARTGYPCGRPPGPRTVPSYASG